METIGNNTKVLLMKTTNAIHPDKIDKLQEKLTKEIGIKVVILPAYIGTVLSI